MTEADEFVIGDFEQKLNRLMDAYGRLKAENAALKEQLRHQSVELDEARKQYKEMSESYSDLQLAKIISVGESELGATQKRLSELVREVDWCIKQLSVSGQDEDVV